MSKILLNFPDGYSPNSSQIKILKGIERAIESEKKFIVCNAPTGSGKSFIAPTLAKYVGGPSAEWCEKVDDYSIYALDGGPEFANSQKRFGVYALTITKSLQDQYKSTFDDTSVLKGKSNYQCDVDDEFTADNAPCMYLNDLKRDCWNCNRCPYYNARNEVIKNEFSALNYNMYFHLPEHLRQRKILILDEASELEEQLVGQFTCEIDFSFMMKVKVPITAFPTEEKAINVLNWLSKLLGEIKKIEDSYLKFFKEVKKRDSEFQKKKGEFSKLQTLDGDISRLIDTYHDSQYIIEHGDKKIKFTPLKVDKLANYMFDNADHVILLSATIIDHPNFCKTLGITDYDYIETDSEFDPDKAPIYILANQKINFKNLKSLLPKIKDQVDGILHEHESDKGIIHTHTQYIADYIRDNIRSKRLLCREDGVKNEDILEEHSDRTDATVLVSPSMTYGVDLKGDLAKFQILLKAPWLPTKDPRIEKLMKLDPTWYVNKMLCTLVQACGRGVRSSSDECQTYILDGSIFDAIAKNKNKLPKYFLDRLQ